MTNHRFCCCGDPDPETPCGCLIPASRELSYTISVSGTAFQDGSPSRTTAGSGSYTGTVTLPGTLPGSGSFNDANRVIGTTTDGEDITSSVAVVIAAGQAISYDITVSIPGTAPGVPQITIRAELAITNGVVSTLEDGTVSVTAAGLSDDFATMAPDCTGAVSGAGDVESGFDNSTTSGSFAFALTGLTDVDCP